MFDGRDNPIRNLVGNENKTYGSSETRSKHTSPRLDEDVKDFSGKGVIRRCSRIFRTDPEDRGASNHDPEEPRTS